ncbi:U1 small nuclear ribonucleoprotein 70 kDa-like [Babylonia areolata]|uniref:U1 small nuclear ribonucleoprotein 70 kDa-like n=1 Tax=Babylonia areolata TaxID=304850 RepID=UPI003FD4ED81
MTQYLPPNLLALFAAREPLPYIAPYDKLPHEKKRPPYIGLSGFLNNFEDPKDTPPPTRVETRDERKERKRKERQEQHAYKLEQDLALWDPNNIPGATTDPYKTLFVARINYDTSESKLRREFEVFGAIKKICVSSERASGKPRGYAFIEYEHERDMHSAYKHADGRKIDGRRVLVDVERGRTVKGWRPRRLGGGLGGTRKGGPDENTRFSGRDDYSGQGAGGAGAGAGYEEQNGARGRADRSRSRERRRGRSRSRSPARGMGGRDRMDRERRRSRSKDRDRRRSRDREERGPEEEEEATRSREKKRSRRSRSRERKRSRSRERKRGRRSRSRDRGRRSRERRIKEEPDVTLEPPFGDGGMGMGGYDNYNNAGYPGGDLENKSWMDFTNVQVKQEPSDAGYPAQMPNVGAPPPPPPPPEDGEDDE